MKTDIYDRITGQIVAELEQGVRPWHKPWSAGHVAGPVSRPLRGCGKPYSGINVLVLWATAMERGYSAPIWMTYRQAAELGAHVRKGEKGTLVVYASKITRSEHDEATGEDRDRQISFLKSYAVFNVEQIDGLPGHFTATAAPRLNPEQRISRAEGFFAALGADIRHGGNSAHYVPALDFVQMPPFESFRDAGSYYGTLAHEMTHWTGHPTRVQRNFPRLVAGSSNYAREELVAELGAAFLCADLGLSLHPRPDHADYIGSWLQLLRNDKRAIFQAAALAQKATDFLHGLQPQTVAEAA